jgi:hypothetical protein
MFAAFTKHVRRSEQRSSLDGLVFLPGADFHLGDVTCVLAYNFIWQAISDPCKFGVKHGFAARRSPTGLTWLPLNRVLSAVGMRHRNRTEPALPLLVRSGFAAKFSPNLSSRTESQARHVEL